MARGPRPQAQLGQFVIVHVGFALNIIDEDEAQQIFAFLDRMDELRELKDLDSVGSADIE